MNTGLTSLAKLPEVTAAYPFHGAEMLYAGAILVLFVVFFAWQLRMETTHHKAIIGNFTASPAE